MSAYISMRCPFHGDWEMDVDNPSETCPKCPSNDDVIAAKDTKIASLRAVIKEFLAIPNLENNCAQWRVVKAGLANLRAALEVKK